MSTIDLTVFDPNRRINRGTDGKMDKEDAKRVGKKVAEPNYDFGYQIGQTVQNMLRGGDGDPTDPAPDKVEKARSDYHQAVERQKITDLSNYLMPEPEEPELDSEGLANSRKQARAGAILQLIDSLSGATALQTGQEEAVHAPVDYSGLGLNAVNEMYRIKDNHKLDLDRYREQKLETEFANMQMKAQIDQGNKALDTKIEQLEYQDVLDERDRKEIENDSNKQSLIDLASRAFSRGAFDIGQAYLEDAEISPEGIDELIKQWSTKQSTTTGSKKSGSGSGSDDTEALTPYEINMRREAKSIQEELDNMKKHEDPDRYETLQESLEYIRKEMGTKFYAPESEWNPRREGKPTADLNEVYGKETVDAGLGGVVKPLENYDLSTEQGRKTYDMYTKNMNIAYDNAQGREEKLKIFEQVVTDLSKAGVEEDKILPTARAMFGITDPETAEEETAEPEEAKGNADPAPVPVQKELKASKQPELGTMESAFPMTSKFIDKATKTFKGNNEKRQEVQSKSAYVGRGLYVYKDDLDQYKKLKNGTPEEREQAKKLEFRLGTPN